MRIWRSLDSVAGVDEVASSVATVGVFDGVHRGHRTVIAEVVSDAGARDAQPVVVTFDPHPVSVVRPELTPPALATLEHRLALLEGQGVGAVLVLPFTAELARQSPEDFVDDVLVDALHVVAVHVGENFRFGYRAAGDVTLLRRLGKEQGFEVRALPLAGEPDQGATWSSTWIRERLAEGDVRAAAAALGRPHRLEGPVVHGDHRGRELGYPTANLASDDHSAVPKDGVYAGWLLRSSGDRLPAAVSIGTNPTFGGTVRRVEAYVLDRDDLDLYDEHVALDFTDRLRDTVRFDGVEPLLEQMADDVRRARELTQAG